MRRPRRLRTWRNKLLLLLLLFSVVPPALLTWWLFIAMQEAWMGSTLESLEGVAGAKAAAIDQFTQDRRAEVERIAGLLAPRIAAVESSLRPAAGDGELLPGLPDAAAVLRPAAPAAASEDETGGITIEVAPRPAPASDALLELRQDLGLVLWDQRRFEELMVIDPRGRVIVSTHEGHEGRTAAGLAYFESGRGATYLEPVFVSPITENLTMVISTPVRDPSRGVVGVLVARLALDRFFRLINDVTGLGTSGETVVGKISDREVVLMAPTRHDAQAALRRRITLGAAVALPLQEAARGHAGAGPAEDYRGREVLAAWRPIPALDWGLVVKVDRAEAMRPLVQAASRMLVLLLVVVTAGIVAALITSRTLVRPLKELKAATERISRGDVDVQLAIDSDDEIGELADSFERMVAAIKFFRAHSRRPEEDEEELTEGPEG